MYWRHYPTDPHSQRSGAHSEAQAWTEKAEEESSRSMGSSTNSTNQSYVNNMQLRLRWSWEPEEWSTELPSMDFKQHTSMNPQRFGVGCHSPKETDGQGPARAVPGVTPQLHSPGGDISRVSFLKLLG